MKGKIVLYGLIGGLVVLLAISFLGNVVQKRLISQLLQEKAAPGDEPARQAENSPQNGIPAIPLLTPEPNASEKDALTGVNKIKFKFIDSNTKFDEEGYAYCSELRASVEGLAECKSDELIGRITVEPPAQISRIQVKRERISIEGRFQCGTEYLVALPEGMPTHKGKTDTRSAFVVKTEKPSPYLGFSEAGKYYPVTISKGQVASSPVALEVFGLDNVTVTLYKIPRGNMDVAGVFKAKSYYGSADEAMLELAERSFEVKSCMKRKADQLHHRRLPSGQVQ